MRPCEKAWDVLTRDSAALELAGDAFDDALQLPEVLHLEDVAGAANELRPVREHVHLNRTL